MKIHPKIEEILFKRGITNREDIEEFLSEKPQLTYNPFLLHNLEEGVDLILAKISEGKNVCIYGDYDTDGITSVVLLYEILSLLTPNLTYYIPSRFDEGYGLNFDAIDEIYKQGADLIITVDCGSISYDEVEYAKSMGVHVVVTDHHIIDKTKADCILINPKQEDCQYSFKGLAGCGVAFKLAQGIVEKAGLPKQCLTEVLDLVAIGTIADVMPLVDENRTLVKFGMRALKVTKRRGLKLLVEEKNWKLDKMNSIDIAYKIIPHLNATGRMGRATLAVQLLLNDDTLDYKEIVNEIIRKNDERKAIQEHTYETCVNELKQDEDNIRNIYLVHCRDAHEGITGIVAGKLKEKYNRPAIIITEAQGNYKGTSRSIEGIDMYELLKTNKHLFLKFGGHRAACGFLLKKEALNEFRENLDAEMCKLIVENPQVFERAKVFDIDADIDSITLELSKDMTRLEPFGMANESPIFKTENVVATNVRKIGKNLEHTIFKVGKKDDNFKIDCLAFANINSVEIKDNDEVNILYNIETNVWKDQEKVQCIIREIEKCNKE